MKKIILVLAALSLQYGIANAQTSDTDNSGETIRLGGVSVGTIESIIIESIIIDKQDQVPRITISIKARFPDFANSLDDILIGRGNLGKCQQRFYWRGSTSVNNGGESLQMTSEVAYELWTCGDVFGNVRWVGDARNVDWKLFVRPAPLDKLYISARVNDIHGWPNWIEGAFGVRITENMKVGLAASCGTCSCMDVMGSVRPRFDDSEFSVEEDGTVFVAATLSVNSDVLTKVLACTP